MTNTQSNEFAEALWSQVDQLGLPSETIFYKFAFIYLPHPPDVEPITLFKNYIEDAQFPIQKDNEISFTRGHIPICEEIIRARNYIEWSNKDIFEIFDRLVEWWDADKKYLKISPSDILFGSTADEFKDRWVMVENMETDTSKKDFSQILSVLGQMVRWQKNIGLPSALNLIAELIKDYPWTFADELERLTLIGLHYIAKDTATNAGGLDISEKLEIREAAAGLAYRLFEYYTRRDAPIPDVLKEWEAICLSDDEFAEIRNQWILQN
ncbi:MAG: hypothetical protein F4W91_14010 [Gemmatimonadetes bacterium]|nr:hypothetical protein [Gemmatimonadota bacterium]